MYIPTFNREEDLTKLHAFIRANSFGTLVTQYEGRPFATNLPYWLEEKPGTPGVLWGHIARANPQWQQSDGETLSIFNGPHAYISPTWYETPNTVPTWNYVAVHAYGKLELFHDSKTLRELLEKLNSVYEGGRENPWRVDSVTPDFFEKLATMIVGFKIEITKIEGKWKLNQNHPKERREKVVAQLSKQSDENSQAIAALMREGLK